MRLPRNPSLEDLRALVAFADSGGVSAAGTLLGQDQAAMSRRLRVFQSDDPLLQRRGRKLELTRKGEHLLGEIRAVVREYDRVVASIATQQNVPRTLCLGAGTFTAEYYLPAMLREIRQELADWEVRVQILRGEQRVLQVASGILDAALVSHTPHQIQALVTAGFGRGESLDIHPVGVHRLCVATQRASPQGIELERLPADQPVPLSSLAAWPLLGLDASSGVRRQLEQRLDPHGRTLRFAIEGGGWNAARAWAMGGLGVAILPEIMLRDTELALVVRRLPSDIVFRDFLVSRQHIPEHQRLVQDVVLRAARRQFDPLASC
jgi:DNA-binding transcriptional LysR family regulator